MSTAGRKDDRVGIYVAFDEFASAVTLSIGEAEVARWPVPRGERDNMKVPWRRNRFAARKLGAAIAAADTETEVPVD